MKNKNPVDLMKLRKELGEALRRGNGGGHETDMAAIRKVAPDFIDNDSWSGDSVAEIATMFAHWVLYSFHSATVPAAGPEVCPFCKSADCPGSGKFDGSSFTTAWARESFGSDPATADLTKLNNRCEILDPYSNIDKDVTTGIRVNRDSVWNDAIAETFPELSEVGKYEVLDPAEAIGLLRVVFNGDDPKSPIDGFEEMVQVLRNKILPQDSDEVSEPADLPFNEDELPAKASNAAEGVAAGVCAGCGGPLGDDPSDYCPTIGSPWMRICSVECAAAIDARIEAARLDLAVANSKFAFPGDDIDPESIPESARNITIAFECVVPECGRGGFCDEHNPQYDEKPVSHLFEKALIESIDNPPPAAERVIMNHRKCDNCNQWFTGPAKLDAKFTFCGDPCQGAFYARVQTKPAVELRPAVETCDGVFDYTPTPSPCRHKQFPFCSNCEGPINPADCFTLTEPGGKPKTVCGVNCVAAVLGIRIRSNDLF